MGFLKAKINKVQNKRKKLEAVGYSEIIAIILRTMQ